MRQDVRKGSTAWARRPLQRTAYIECGLAQNRAPRARCLTSCPAKRICAPAQISLHGMLDGPVFRHYTLVARTAFIGSRICIYGGRALQWCLDSPLLASAAAVGALLFLLGLLFSLRSAVRSMTTIGPASATDGAAGGERHSLRKILVLTFLFLAIAATV